MKQKVITLNHQIGLGDRAAFRLSIEFLRDPEPCGQPEENVSWGRFQMWAGGRNLCAHYVNGELCESVTWYLLPMLEALVRNWDFLLHEQKLPHSNVEGSCAAALASLNTPETFETPGGWNSKVASRVDEWARRHSLAMSRAGGLFPDMWFRRFGANIEVSWTDKSPICAPDDFQFCNGNDSVLIEPELVAEPLYGVVKQAAETLHEALGNNARINTLRRSIRSLRDKNRQKKRVSILAGLGITTAAFSNRWTRLVKNVRQKHKNQLDAIDKIFTPSGNERLYLAGECSGALMFACVSPNNRFTRCFDISGTYVGTIHRRL